MIDILLYFLFGPTSVFENHDTSQISSACLRANNISISILW